MEVRSAVGVKAHVVASRIRPVDVAREHEVHPMPAPDEKTLLAALFGAEHRQELAQCRCCTARGPARRCTLQRSIEASAIEGLEQVVEGSYLERLHRELTEGSDEDDRGRGARRRCFRGRLAHLVEGG